MTLNSVPWGWVQCCDRLYKKQLFSILYRYLDRQIVAWLRRKYKRMRGRWGAHLAASETNQASTIGPVCKLAPRQWCDVWVMGTV